MKKVLLLFILLCFGQPLLAQDNKNPVKPEKKPSSAREENAGKKPKQQPTGWPQPFTPSQEIGADSQISFPTDI